MFKVGDKVRYVGESSGFFTSGNEYTVGGKYHGASDDIGVIACDNGAEDGHRAHMFELVQPKFKPGDCVRAVRSFMDVTENKIYVVISDALGDLNVVDDVGDHMSINWDKPLFELVHPEFKPGDRVRIVGRSAEPYPHNYKIGSIQTVQEIYDDGSGVDCGEWGCAYDEIELVAEPVREVTRREMVPGQYGRVHIARDRNVHCESMRTADEIRDAIKVLSQILEVMSDE